MRLDLNGNEIRAHVPNTGRMEEFLTYGTTFFLISSGGKYPYRVVSTIYKGNFVLIDTIKINRIVEELIRRGLVPEFIGLDSIRREYSILDSKFDFRLKNSHTEVVLEVKSCTLYHNRWIMFPDAPTERGLRHLQDLERISKSSPKLSSFILYLTTHYDADYFSPNYHTDYEYARFFRDMKNVNTLAYKLKMKDPVTVDENSLRKIKIDNTLLEKHCSNSGYYLLVLRNPGTFKQGVGAIGDRIFKKGFYIYVGSAKKNLQERVLRHERKQKKVHWHIDYVFPGRMNLIRSYLIRSGEDLESQVASSLMDISDGYVRDFGSSDSPAVSHFFHFSQNPLRKAGFQELLLDVRMPAI
jgi:sugar fermentation stimulation protein A